MAVVKFVHLIDDHGGRFGDYPALHTCFGLVEDTSKSSKWWHCPKGFGQDERGFCQLTACKRPLFCLHQM